MHLCALTGTLTQAQSMGVVRLLTLSRAQYDVLATMYPMDCKKVLENLLAHQEEVGGPQGGSAESCWVLGTRGFEVLGWGGGG